MKTRGAAALPSTRSGFKFAGLSYYDGRTRSMLHVAADATRSLNGTPFDNRTSSMYVYWSTRAACRPLRRGRQQTPSNGAYAERRA